MKKPEIILAFDLGKASLGICARTEDRLLALRALEIPAEFAAIADFRTRRRMWRTRQAHRARETFFMEKLWMAAGLPDYRQPSVWEALKASLPACYGKDKKLWTREFPAKGDAADTVFNSALLRIQLIESDRTGLKLEPWQIWRALWSAIQKRGHHYYDWKSVPKELLTEDLDAGIDLAIDSMLKEANQFKRQIEDREAAKLTVGKIGQDEIKEEIKVLKAQEKEWKEANKDFLDDLEKLQGFKQVMADQVQDVRQFGFPCYLEARRMKLWQPVYDITTKEFESLLVSPRIGFEPEPLRTEEQKMPRAFRIKELKTLWEQAIEQLHQLKALDKSADYFLFGETEQPYATVGWDKSRPDRFKVMGMRGRAVLDWQGVLGQKVPRFDNRIIAKCQLFPTRNVCKASDELNIKFSLLTQLKNLTVKDHAGVVRGLTPDEFNRAWAVLWELKNASYEVSFTALGKVAKAALPGCDGFFNLAQREKLQAHKDGRARFCRRALQMMTDILLSGWNPPEVQAALYADQPKHGKLPPNCLTAAEVRTALGDLDWTKEQSPESKLKKGRLGRTWQGFHVGDDRDEAMQKGKDLRTRCTDPATGEIDQKRLKQLRHEAVQKLVGSSNNPIVRNRLMIFYRELAKLEQWLRDEHSLDVASEGRVIIEFIRGADSGFDGKKSADQFNKAIKENQANNEEQAKKLQDAGMAPTRKSMERMKLLKEQGGICVYTGEKIIESQLGKEYDIDHIVPQSARYYSDALWNKVLTRTSINQQQKKAQTPYQWLANDKLQWEKYLERVKAIYGRSDKKSLKRKLALLTQPDAEMLLETYNGLAETGYMARLAQQIVALQFGWGLQTIKTDDDSGRKVFVNDGATTARIRKHYDLEVLLLTGEEQARLFELRAKIKEANRRHRELGFCEQRQAEIRGWRQEMEPLDKKKRANPRHHALDAFCISFSQSVKRQQRENGKWMEHIPELEHTRIRAQMEAKLANLFVPTIRRNSKETYPEETIYRYSNPHQAVLIRRSLPGMFGKKDKADEKDKTIRKIVDRHIRQDLSQKAMQLAGEDWMNYLLQYVHPVRRTPVIKVLCYASEIKESPTLNEQGQPESVTEYRDYGHDGTQGQFKRTKQHKGQLLYKDNKGKWKVYPVYGYMSVKEALADIAAKGWQVYHDPGTGEPMLFYSSAPIYLPQAVKDGKAPAGEYKLRTLMSSGQVKLESNAGLEILTSVKEIVETECRML